MTPTPGLVLFNINPNKNKRLHMSLFPDEDVLTKEIQSWEGFAEQLSVEDRQIFMKTLNDCYQYSTAIKAKGQPFPSEPLIMALLFLQHKLIEWLENQWKKV
jgi:hypothetical protein